MTEKAPRAKRGQAAKDAATLHTIAVIVAATNRFDVKDLRERLDQIGDVLVEAGQL